MSDPPSKRGRPSLDPDRPSVPVQVRLPSPQYDALWAEARRQDMTVPELIRRTLRDKPAGNSGT